MIKYRIVENQTKIFKLMNLTALIPDGLIEKVKAKSGGENISESLIIAKRISQWKKS